MSCSARAYPSARDAYGQTVTRSLTPAPGTGVSDGAGVLLAPLSVGRDAAVGPDPVVPSPAEGREGSTDGAANTAPISAAVPASVNAGTRQRERSRRTWVRRLMRASPSG